MKVEKNKVVAVSYDTGMLLPKFEANLEGKEPGDSFGFTLSPEEGYGKYDERFRIDVPISAFEVNGELRKDLLVPGRILPMFNSEGQVVQGKIEKIGEDTVTMDFNHPMAGKTLNFTGKVESVRSATEKELTEGLHGEYLPNEGCHCGGDCGGDGCGEGGCCGHGDGECGHHGGHGCCHGDESKS